jgi:hypothetical protein
MRLLGAVIFAARAGCKPVHAAKIMVAKGLSRAEGSRFAERKRSDRRSRLDLDAEHGSGAATSKVERRSHGATGLRYVNTMAQCRRKSLASRGSFVKLSISRTIE